MQDQQTNTSIIKKLIDIFTKQYKDMTINRSESSKLLCDRKEAYNLKPII